MVWFYDRFRRPHWKSTRGELGLDTDDSPYFAGVNVSPPQRLRLRPALIQTTAKAGGVPTEVYKGLNVGYSLPIWSAPQPNEQLQCRLIIPARWDSTTDPQFMICASLSAAEDVGDKFKFSLEWQITVDGNEMSDTTSTCYSEQAVLTGRAAAYDLYYLWFTFDADDANNPITVGDMMQCRLRRIDAADPDVSNEIIVWDWTSLWPVTKMFGSSWAAETNDT